MLPSAASLERKPVPKVRFRTRINQQWQDVTTDAVCNDKTMVVICLPGAYAPAGSEP